MEIARPTVQSCLGGRYTSVQCIQPAGHLVTTRVISVTLALSGCASVILISLGSHLSYHSDSCTISVLIFKLSLFYLLRAPKQRVVMLAIQIHDREALNKLPEHRKVKILVLIRRKYHMPRLPKI